MAYTVSIAPLTPTAVIGATTNFTATGAGAAVAGTESFVWTVDGVPQASVIATMDYIAAGPAGSKVIKVVATTTPEEGEPETAEAQTTITVNNKTMSATATLTTSTPTVKVGQEYKASANVTGEPGGATITYLWSTGETTKDITRTATVAGPVSLTCQITVSAADYDNQVINPAAVVVTVEEAEPVIPEECPLIYVHPLPVRNTAYIWCGWWVMDAIQKLTSESKDWKKATKEDTPYYCHLAVLAKMLSDYPEVDVQESRNGRIVHRSALEVGIIYDYVY